MRAWNKSPTPFAWTKPADAIIKSHRRMLKRISTAVHGTLFAIDAYGNNASGWLDRRLRSAGTEAS